MRLRRNLVQNVSSFAGADLHRNDLAMALGVDRHGHDHRHADDGDGLAGLDVIGVNRPVRSVALDRAVEGGAHPLDELAAKPVDLAVGDAGHTHGFDQVAHGSLGHPVNIGLWDDRGQGLLGGASRLQAAGEVAGLLCPR